MKKNILIIGGTSGIGLKLAKHYAREGHNVCITGRRNPCIDNIAFLPFNITHDQALLAEDCDRILKGFPNVQTLVYAAGFLQRGHIDEIDDIGLTTMINVGLLAPMMLIQRIKKSATQPPKIMLVTSSSQFTPRELEPAYCATKSGMGMLGASLARDDGIGKVLVVAPAGIKTPFWSNTNEDTTTMLDPRWVADQIVELSTGPFKYRYAKLLRSPARVEMVESIPNG